MKRVNMLGNKIVAQSFLSITKLFGELKAPVRLLAAGVFISLLPACLMTKAQGDVLSQQMREIEGEVAKLQRVRHDLELLLNSQVKDLIDRLAKLETQVRNVKENLKEGSSKNTALVEEVQNLRGQLEEAQHRYKNLEQEQKNLLINQVAISEAQKKISIPPLKDEHFALAKKYYTGDKLADSIYLFEEFNKQYSSDQTLSGQSYYFQGEANRRLAENEKVHEEAQKLYKKSVISYQKSVELNKTPAMREEALFRMGMVLKTMGETQAALAAFKELLNQNGKSKRASEVKKEMASLSE